LITKQINVVKQDMHMKKGLPHPPHGVDFKLRLQPEIYPYPSASTLNRRREEGLKSVE